MKRYPQVAAFILAGGLSSRMGKDKGLLEVGGEPLVVRTVRSIEPLVHEVTVVGPPERYGVLGLRSIADRTFRCGGETEAVRTPLSAIATALSITSAPWNLVLACDLPYVTSEWLNWLIARALNSQAQIVMPRTSRGPEPLAAVYSIGCAAPIVDALERGIRKVTDAISEFRIEFVLEKEWDRCDPDHRVLRNMNTPADYEEAQTWAKTSNRQKRTHKCTGP
jgi:molybdenum cofactor guanylyltransferase